MGYFTPLWIHAHPSGRVMVSLSWNLCIQRKIKGSMTRRRARMPTLVVSYICDLEEHYLQCDSVFYHYYVLIWQEIDIEEDVTVSRAVSNVFKGAWDLVNPFKATIEPDIHYFTAPFTIERQDEWVYHKHISVLTGPVWILGRNQILNGPSLDPWGIPDTMHTISCPH